MIPFQPHPRILGGFLGKKTEALDALGFQVRDLVTLKQVHGDRILEIHEPAQVKETRNAPGDAIVSTVPGIPIAVRSADCVPLLMAHPEGIIAAVHAGWRGTDAKIVCRVASLFQEKFGLGLSRLNVAIGPAISGKNYEVGPDVGERFREFEDKDILSKKKSEKFLLDLQRANRELLERMGVPKQNIQVHPICTWEFSEEYFSARRGLALGHEKTGRNYSWVLLKA